RKFGVHRRMVRDAIASAVPPARKAAPRERPKLGPATAFIEEILQSDRKAPRKQRHTAHRIWVRLRREMPEVVVAESTVRRFVHTRKRELGLTGGGETFIPQSYRWGQEAQVDWYEAWAELGGERQKLFVFCMRSMASGGAFHRVYPHASQQAFLEAHELAFQYFGGVFALWRARHNANYVKDRIMRRSLPGAGRDAVVSSNPPHNPPPFRGNLTRPAGPDRVSTAAVWKVAPAALCVPGLPAWFAGWLEHSGWWYPIARGPTSSE